MSSPRSDIVRLRDMLAAIEAIEQYSAGLDFAAFAAQQQVQHAVLFNMQVIGEAASRLDAGVRQSYPAVPWLQIIGMRHVIVHGYFSINLTIIWNTLSLDLPQLKPQLAAMLATLEIQP